MTDLSQYLKPELLILIPVLYILSNLIKQFSCFCKAAANLTVCLIGIALACLYVLSAGQIHGLLEWMDTIFSMVTQGILAYGVSTGLQYVVERQQKKKEDP